MIRWSTRTGWRARVGWAATYPFVVERGSKMGWWCLTELRIKGAEGIARGLFCCVAQQRIVMLHVVTKKSRKTPLHELRTARHRMQEVITREPQ